MAQRIREHDWIATPLGPIETWPGELNGLVELILASPLVSSVVCGPERILLYNDALARHYGERHLSVLGRPLSTTWPDDRGVARALYDRVFAGETVHVPAQPLDLSGRSEEPEVFDAYVTPVRGPDGRIAYAHMTGFEISARLKAEQQNVRAEERLRESEGRQAFLLKLSDTLRPISDPVDIQEAASRMVGEHLGVERAAYGELEPDNEIMAVERDWRRPGVASTVGRFHIDDFGTFFTGPLRAGRMATIEDAATDPRIPSDMRAKTWDAIGVRSAVAYPIVKEGRFVAAFFIHHDKPRNWSAGELTLVAEVADRTWEAVERARAESALRESEARLSAAFESVPVGAAVVDLSGAAIVSNREYRRFLPTGIVPSRDPLRGGRWRAWDQEGRPLERHDFPAARAMQGESVVPGQEMLYTDDDGREIWTSVATVPTRDDQGLVTGVVTIISDIDIAKRSTKALQESEERFRQFGEASLDVLWIRDAETFQWEYLTPAFEMIYGLDRKLALSGDNMAGWLQLIVPEDRDLAANALQRVRDGERVTFEYRIRRPSDGEVRWLRNTDFPIKDDEERVIRIGGIGRDITEEKENAERLAVLVAELQHRTRNLMSVVRSLGEQTLRSAASLDGFMPVFRDRMEALARVNGLLSRLTDGHRIAFDELIRSEIEAIGPVAREDGRVTLSGPEGVLLRSSTVQTFALALHELATNAAKYGALRQLDGEGPQGHLSVTWQLDWRKGEPWLHVDWRESGVAMPPDGAAPRGGGAGRQLIERALPYQLGAKTTFVMAADGVWCSISLPVSQRTAARKVASIGTAARGQAHPGGRG